MRSKIISLLFILLSAYTQAFGKTPIPFSQSIEKTTQYFLELESPYLAGPLGEGRRALFDRSPSLRVDGFDCTTFIETILSLTQAVSQEELDRAMAEIRYKDNLISFLSRNHFPSVDWIPNNIANGIFRDITEELSSNTFYATGTIDKNGWYRKMKIERIKRKDLTLLERQSLLKELKLLGKNIAKEVPNLPYIHMSEIFKANSEGQYLFNHRLMNKIPSGAVINIVCPDWKLKKFIGTNMNVSHQGFAIKENDHLYFRHASSAKGAKKIVNEKMESYLRKYIKSESMQGINILLPLSL